MKLKQQIRIWGTAVIVAISSLTTYAGVLKTQTADLTDAANWVGGYRYYADNAGVAPSVEPVNTITSNGTIISSASVGTIEASAAGIGNTAYIVSKDLYTDGGELDAAGNKFATLNIVTNVASPHYLVAIQNDQQDGLGTDIVYFIALDERRTSFGYEIRGDGSVVETVGGASSSTWKKFKDNSTSGYSSAANMGVNASPDFTATGARIYYGFCD